MLCPECHDFMDVFAVFEKAATHATPTIAGLIALMAALYLHLRSRSGASTPPPKLSRSVSFPEELDLEAAVQSRETASPGLVVVGKMATTTQHNHEKGVERAILSERVSRWTVRALIVIAIILFAAEHGHLLLSLDVLAWIERYHEAAHERPIITKALTSLVAYGVGDLLAQALTARASCLDKGRLWRCCFVGFFLHGPSLHFWIQALEYLVNDLVGWPRGTWYSIAAKVALDQTFFAVILNTAFTWVMCMLECKSYSVFVEQLRKTLLPALFSSWRFWPMVHMISYSPVVPIELKVLWIDVCEIVWVAILSSINARAENSEAKHAPLSGKEDLKIDVDLEDPKDQEITDIFDEEMKCPSKSYLKFKTPTSYGKMKKVRALSTELMSMNGADVELDLSPKERSYVAFQTPQNIVKIRAISC
jgi:protein Mpv17